MSTSVRARHDERGFSMVELLVAIVLAAIISLAMVPLFLNMARASSRDRARNIAMDVAQGRIDGIQLLSWSQLTDPNINASLQSNTVPGVGLFGPTYSPPGSSAVYNVTYQVTPVPSSGVTNYVRVQVHVTTPSLPGSGPHTATMATIVIKPPAAGSGSSPPVPTLTSFTPTSGAAGTVVTLTGTGFLGATAVRFNNSAASAFTVVSDTRITATVQVGATTGPISVTTPGGTVTSGANFTVTPAPPPAPTITSFTPASGAAGTQIVTLTGTGFSGATAVRFNGTSASTFSVVTGTQITAIVPAGATTGPISVTTLGGTATSATSFTVTVSPTLYTLTVNNTNTGAASGKHRWLWVQNTSIPLMYYSQSGVASSAAPAGVDVAGSSSGQFNLPNGTYTILVSTSSSPSAAVAQTPPSPVIVSSAAKTVSIH